MREYRASRRRREADERNERALRTLIAEGSVKRAAAMLGVSETWLRQRVREYCDAHGYEGPVQAAYQLARRDLDRHFLAVTHESA